MFNQVSFKSGKLTVNKPLCRGKVFFDNAGNNFY
jgi:hypothetical protein